VNTERMHRATSPDGTMIVGRVHGHGPPLVFVHGVTGDGDADWDPLLPLVAPRFSCYLMSTRGRGLSADHPSHATESILQDVVSFIESIGEPVGLVGFSSGGAYALHAAAETPAAAAVAAYEPALTHVLTPQDGMRIGDAAGRAAGAAAEGRFAQGIQEFTADCVATDDEAALLSSRGYYQASAPNAPALVRGFSQAGESSSVSGEPATLSRIGQPTLLMRGTGSALRLFRDAVEHAAVHVPDARVRELPGAGHFAPILEPEPVAEELIRFFEGTLVAR
jgi:pimeloyl-ACP methyl ester carboxylesterase